MEKQFDILRKLLTDAEHYHNEGEQDISRSLLKSIADYTEKMREKPKAITGFKNEK